MPEIPRPQPTDSVSWPHSEHQNSGHHGKRGHHGTGYGSYENAQNSPGMAPPADSISSLGQSIGDLSPAVRQVLYGLIAEQDNLRQALTQSEGRINFLETLCDQHAYMPLLNRRAMLREIDAFTHARPHPFGDESQSVGCLILFYLVNFEKLHRHVGLIDAENALIHLAQQIASTVRPYDRVGSVGGAGVLVMMPETAIETAHAKMAELLNSARDSTLILNGVQVRLDVQAAVLALAMDDDSEDCLRRVDALLRATVAQR